MSSLLGNPEWKEQSHLNDDYVPEDEQDLSPFDDDYVKEEYRSDDDDD